jgi:hypothetical protein
MPKSPAIAWLLFSLVVAAGVVPMGCGDDQDWHLRPTPTHVPTITQGLYGRVVLIEGDCMPVTTPERCRISYPSRRISVREPATLDDMVGTYLVTSRPLVAATTADERGFYEVQLPPGTYSVFVEDGGREYCNRFGGQLEACQVTVGEGIKEHHIQIDHASS